LLSVIPTVSDEEKKSLPEVTKLYGEIPSPMDLPTGCRFHTRCPRFFDPCDKLEPEPLTYNGHELRCHLYSPEHSEERIA
jgi:oligopeptide/dipeptide ABC transporter ATP-binding protein